MRNSPLEIKLDVGYRSQQENRARLDCGAAVVAMVAGQSVDEALAAIEQPKDKALDFAAMFRALRHYGLPHLYRNDLDFEMLRGYVADGYPVIVLANYGILSAGLKSDQTFTGAHYFLVVGASLYGVYVHDVNRPPQSTGGRYLYINGELFERMMAKPGGDDPKWQAAGNQGIVIRRKFGFVVDAAPEPADDGDGVVTTEIAIEQVMAKLQMVIEERDRLAGKLAAIRGIVEG